MVSCCIADLKSADATVLAKVTPSPISRPAECNSAIQQIENLRYEEFGPARRVSAFAIYFCCIIPANRIV
jgi:hypothetical protein